MNLLLAVFKHFYYNTYMVKTREKVLGYGIDLVSFNDALLRVDKSIKNKSGMQIITINPEMISQGHSIPEMNEILNSAELVIPDGIGIKIALKLKGIEQERIAGVEFAKKIVELCEKNGYKIALLGAKEEILNKTAENLKKEFPMLQIVYARNGYFSKDEELQIKEDIKNAAPDVVFTALGAPKQEIFNKEMKQLLPESVFIGIGGSFDVWSGVVQRAPEIWQKTGMEWLYRTIKEPQRFKRIFPTLPLFLIKVIMEVRKEK